MKQLFENWRKHVNEIGPSPSFQKTLDRAQRGYDKAFAAAQADRTPEEVEEDEVQDLADKFNVEASFEIASDGKPAILVTHQDGETTVYHDTEEMYRDLSDEVGRDLHGDPDRDEDDWLYEMDLPSTSIEDQKYEYAKNMFNTQLNNILDDFVKESDGKFDESMKMRILRGAAKVLGDRQQT
tara:strand:+ start:324 stop:869 length:546 start_codon:yes stop_codon:yes gene_type:complete